jgi:hypothetical protein
MRTRMSIRTIFAAAAAVAMAATGLTFSAALPASALVTVTSHFIWTATSSNEIAGITLINNGATNGLPNALLFVTPTYDAGGVCGCVTDPKPIAVFWAGGAKKWAILNQDFSNVPLGAAFNVLVVQNASSQVFVATATAQNTKANGTIINSTAINGNSNVLLQVTQSLPGGLAGVLNNHPIGVVYGLGAGGNQWDIQNVDNAAMPLGAKFNVMVGAAPSHGGAAVLLTGTSANTFGSSTFVNNPETNGNPNAVVFETQNADPGLHFGTGDVAPTGVIYLSSPRDILAVFNENGSFMPSRTHYFNLLIFPS